MRLLVPASAWRRAIARPGTLISSLLLVAALIFMLGGLGREAPALEPIEISTAPPPTVERREVRLVPVDENGLEVPTYAEVALPTDPAQRLAAVLLALQEVLAERGAWPEGLPNPVVFVETIDRRRIAVLDFRPGGPLALSVDEESRLLRSIRSTVLENGADEVRFLRNGEPEGVFLEHLAVPSAL